MVWGGGKKGGDPQRGENADGNIIYCLNGMNFTVTFLGCDLGNHFMSFCLIWGTLGLIDVAWNRWQNSEKKYYFNIDFVDKLSKTSKSLQILWTSIHFKKILDSVDNLKKLN